MAEYLLNAGTATSNYIKKSTLISSVTSPNIISSSSAHGDVLSVLLSPETAEEREDRLWEKALNSPHGQRTLDFLLAEAHQQIANGEFEEGGFGLE